jgi:hypothetical protein
MNEREFASVYKKMCSDLNQMFPNGDYILDEFARCRHDGTYRVAIIRKNESIVGFGVIVQVGDIVLYTLPSREALGAYQYQKWAIFCEMPGYRI